MEAQQTLKHNKALVLVATPLTRVPAGGFIRDAKVMPFLIDKFRELGLESILYVPIYSIVVAVKLLINNNNTNAEEAFNIIWKDLLNIRMRGLDNTFTEESLQKAYAIFKRTYKRTLLNRINGFGHIYIQWIKRAEYQVLKKVIRHILTSYDYILFVYSMNENLEHLISMNKLCRSLRTHCTIMLQQALYRLPGLHASLPNRLFPYLSSITLSSFIRSLLLRLARTQMLKLLLSVSPAPLIESGDLVNIAREYDVKIAIPMPGNAIDVELLRYRKLGDKEPIAVYFGRLTPSKGIYDLLYAWKIIEDSLPRAKLLIIGSFDSNKTQQVFYYLLRKLKPRNVKLLGFLKERTRLYQIISKAKVLIYPSQEDSYSLTVLEAIALGLNVVAYDIPAIRYIYGSVPAVKRVRLRDIRGLARAATILLSQDPELHAKLQTDPRTQRLIKMHSSWENVARAEMSKLKYLFA